MCVCIVHTAQLCAPVRTCNHNSDVCVCVLRPKSSVMCSGENGHHNSDLCFDENVHHNSDVCSDENVHHNSDLCSDENGHHNSDVLW